MKQEHIVNLGLFLEGREVAPASGRVIGGHG